MNVHQATPATRGKLYEYCQCGAVRRLENGNYDEWHVCKSCATGRACQGEQQMKRSLQLELDPGTKVTIEWIVGRFHVGTPDEEIIANMRERCAKNKLTPAQREAVEAYAIVAHNENRKLYAFVMGGY